MGTEIDGVNGIIKNTTSDGDVTIKGNDGGSEISALVFDMSAAGAATFNGKITADAGIDIDNFNIDGTTIALSSGDITLDAAGDIILDADGGDIRFKDGGTEIAVFENSSSDLQIKAAVQDKDIIFRGNDGGAGINALVLDMSDAGAATFNNKIVATELDISGDIDVDGTTNLDVVDIDGAVNMATTLVVGGVITVIDGSTSAPSITNAGDTNSGIYFPADDNIGLVVGGSRKLLANSTGVSIANGTFAASGGAVFNEGSADVDFRVESNGNANMLFVDGGSDHVNIGTATDLGSTLNVAGDVTASGGSFKLNADDFLQFSNNSFARFVVNDTEIMRATATGQILQGVTSSGSVFRSKGVANGELAFHFSNSSTNSPYGGIIDFDATGASGADNNTQYFLRCGDTTAIRFFIYSDGDVQNHDNSYGAISDERIKSNITDANSQWNDIKNIKVRNFQKKDDIRDYGADKAKVQLGVIAQELETVSPKLVKEYNPTNNDIMSDSVFGTLYEDGDDIPENNKIGDVKEIKEQVKGVNYSILYMKAIKALQEAQTRIETLETKVAALEG